MYAPHILSAALAASAPAEQPPADDFEFKLEQVELVRGQNDDAQIVAYDSAGEVIGAIAIWAEPDGRIILASDYADGYAETVVTDGRARTEATLRPEIITRRAELMLDTIDYGGPGTGPQEGALGCAVTVAIATGLCAPLAAGHVWGAATCAAGVVSSWCKCAPVLGLDKGSACDEF